jgi:uncharacterized protein YcbX
MTESRDDTTPRLAHIAVYPVKALDPVAVDQVGVTDIGGLDNDRAYAMVTGDGEYLNGKRTDAVHRIRSDIDLNRKQISLGVESAAHPPADAPAESERDGPREFHLDDDRAAIEEWLSARVEQRVTLEVGVGGSLTDGVVYGDTDNTGPTLTSAATLREVASWYDGIDAHEMCLRLRPNLVVEGVPAFWEDLLVGDDPGAVQIGDVRLTGTHPIPRCVVPTRDPHTGEADDGFRERFVDRREATLPEWTDRAAFDGNLYSVTVGTRIPEHHRDGQLHVESEVQVV